MLTRPHHLIARSSIRSRPRAFATALVIWAIALGSIILVSLQIPAFRQATDGREIAARIRATWAARAGLERTIVRLQQEADAAEPFGASTLLSSLSQDAEGSLAQATFAVAHYDPASPSGVSPGPTDAQAKLNINTMTFDDLMLLPDMTEDIAYAILDFIDTDEEPRELGAEAEAYMGLPASYSPRNAPLRDIRELELVLGVKPEIVRGEDWNLNGILDPNENDADASWPPDNADGVLDSGWAALMTASGTTGGISLSGMERVDLATADTGQVSQALGVDDQQAQAIVTHAQGGGKLEDFIRDDLNTISQNAASGSTGATQQPAAGGAAGTGARGGAAGGRQQQQPQIKALTRDQIAVLLEECTIGEPKTVSSGKLNLNTCPIDALEYITAIDPTLRDALVLFRDQAGGDIAKLTDLLDVPQMTNAKLADLYPYLDVRSNVFQVVVRGRDAPTGVFVEMVAEIDRSTLPVTIRKLSVR
jgi:type II secretory pathway component PulK